MSGRGVIPGVTYWDMEHGGLHIVMVAPGD